MKTARKESCRAADEVLPDEMDGEKFRQLSDTKKRSYDLQGVGLEADPGQQRCHRVPNSICTDAYNATSDQQIKRELLGFAFSKDNVVFCQHNPTQTKNETDIKGDTANKGQVQQKEGMILTALRSAMASQKKGKISPKTIAHLIRTMATKSDAYERIVDGLDERTFNDPTVKEAIEEVRYRRKQR